jgi:hypothetical protein
MRCQEEDFVVSDPSRIGRCSMEWKGSKAFLHQPSGNLLLGVSVKVLPYQEDDQSGWPEERRRVRKLIRICFGALSRCVLKKFRGVWDPTDAPSRYDGGRGHRRRQALSRCVLKQFRVPL